jgi:ethanolamine permease
MMIWGLGVGYVISGNYFGWNLGLEKGGTLGLAVATAFAIVMYVTFTFSYAELACAVPRAGGAFDYATRSLGKDAGFITGMAQNIEFIFAPPAIAFAIGSYLNLFIPDIPVVAFSAGAYLIFTLLNGLGIQAAAAFELVVTTVAVAGLIFFACLVLPFVSFENLSRNSLPHGIEGVFAAVPFAIWFFLGIEGVANLAEETRNPQRAMSVGFLSALFTLIVVCLLTFIAAVGIGGWEAVVFRNDGQVSDSPLPMAMEQVSGARHFFYTILVVVGLFGLVASFNGLMLAAGRSTYEFGRQVLASKFLGAVNVRTRAPVNALVVNMVVGIIALFTGRTGEVITIAVFGALTLYCFSMLSVLMLRRDEPGLERPFKTPFYPYFPIIALVIAFSALIAVAAYNLLLCGIYLLIIGLCFGIFKVVKKQGA